LTTLKSITQQIEIIKTIGDVNIAVNMICIDSRKVGEGVVFVAIKGTNSDGHDFIDDVINKGAVAIVCEVLPATLRENITYLRVKDSSESLGFMASAFYGNPSSKLKLVGVTGTNGKTTVATLLHQLFTLFGHNVGLISTVENKINETIIPATHTTPDAIALNELIAWMADAQCEYVFMECSSHAIHQNRIAGLNFDGALFTNLTHDHLDYHKTFADYRDVKKKFFDNLDENAFAIVNKDDRNGSVMLQNTKASCYTYSMSGMADFRVKIVEQDFNGMLLNIDGIEFWVQLTGEFNAYNICVVYATAFLLGKEKTELLPVLSALKPVNGRFDYFQSATKITAIVDYAHTPDALKNVLTTINKIRTRNENLITIIGCGGDRDKTKRPVMAHVACELSDKVILSSDNPRTENPETILDEMEAGVPGEYFKKVLRITDRKAAIKTAVASAKPGDIILLAGKGHETYQEINGVKHHFDDKEEVRKCFQLMEK
jgi:UDP-N-acetylmuramoyl-L-alanyl-D-glutamate--2,6-diaminopimelate ligase